MAALNRWTGTSGNDNKDGTAAKDVLQGLDGADTLRGMAGADELYGGNGSDQLFGGADKDRIDGGADNDLISGDGAADDLSGGTGADIFDYQAASDSTAARTGLWSSTTGDTIRDFSRVQGDRIDLSDLPLSGSNAPTNLQWRGQSPATPGPYSVWYTQDGTNTFVYADTSGDGKADLAIRVMGMVNLQDTDFVGVSQGSGNVNQSPNATGENLLVEDNDGIVTGSVATNDSDPDADTLTYALTQSAPAGLTFNSNGSYSFDASAYASLADGKTQVVTATYQVSDGRGGVATATLSITITGTNNGAQFSGAATGAVTEDGDSDADGTTTQTVSGALIITDMDEGQNQLVPVPANTAGDNGYGTFEVGANGQWTYSLSNGNAAVQALAAQSSLTDTLTVTSVDGTTHTITVTIWGAAENTGPLTVQGTAGDDILNGTSADEVIYGLAGNDQLWTGSGSDQVFGGDGQDVIHLENLDAGDYAEGGADTDTLFVHAANATGVVELRLGALSFNSQVTATGFEAYHIEAGSGADTLIGGALADYFDGGAGDDLITTGDGANQAYGETGSDFITGGAGADILSGGAGSDTIRGGGGDDTISGGSDYDLLYGGGGDDLVSTGNGGDDAYGGAGNDTMTGGSGWEYLYAEEGNDTLSTGEGGGNANGMWGNDTLLGGSGGDILFGGSGNDSMTGGAGADWFEFSYSDGTTSEGVGADTVTDFQSGTDKLRLFYDLTISQQQLVNADSDGVADDLRLTLSNGGTIDLLNVSALAAGDIELL